jgi:hypothetical protein
MNQQGINIYLNVLDYSKREERTLSLGQDRLIKQPPPEPVEFDGVEQGEDQPPPEPIEFEDIEQGENQPPPEPVEFDDFEQGKDRPPPEPIEFEE